MTLLYNLVMAALDVTVLVLLARHAFHTPTRKAGVTRWCAVMAGAGAAALVLAGIIAVLREDHFGFVRLAAYGLFLHGVVLLWLSTVLVWRTSRLLAGACALAAVGLLLVACDAFLVEPTWLEVSRVRIVSEKVHRPQKIVVLADLQTDRLGDYERDVFRLAVQEKPDVILLAGDYLQPPREEYGSLSEEFRRFLREIDLRAPGGVFAIRGNVDGDYWFHLFDGLEVTTADSTRSFELDQLRLTCLSLRDSYQTSLRIPHGDADRFHLVLGHSPNFALGRIEADLLVAGHTHGGQVRLPGIGPLITHSRVPNRRAAGLSDDLLRGGKLLVSRGIGMERGYAPRMRFLCRPELVVIELVPAHIEEKTVP